MDYERQRSKDFLGARVNWWITVLGVVLVNVLAWAFPNLVTPICKWSQETVMALSIGAFNVASAIKMWLDSRAVKAAKSAIPLLILTLLSGCVTAKFEIRPDPNPAPMDVNYHTMLVGSSCGAAESFGQAGCSFESTDEAWQHFLNVYTPLGGSVKIYSRECAYDEPPRILPQGGTVKISLRELVPIGTKFCTFSIWTYWEKPKEITTEVPVRGQSAKFYVKVRAPGEAPSGLSWSPESGAPSGRGLIYAQFREFAGGEEIDHREPILLKVELTKPVEKGLYSIWSEAKQIGLKKVEFSGQMLFVHRDDILAAKPGSYHLQGTAVDAFNLRDDFVVALDVFGVKAAKLGASVEFREGQVCFRSENTVSLVLLSGNPKPSNKTAGCFKEPLEPAVMAFFTNVGRAAYVKIENGEAKWIQ